MVTINTSSTFGMGANFENLSAKIDGFGTILNYEDYLHNLEEVFGEQKIINLK